RREGFFMKKLLMVIVYSLLLITLGACGDTKNEDQVDTDNDIEKNEEQDETDNETEETEEENETENNREENESNEDKTQQKEQNKKKTKKEINEYKEANTIEDKNDIDDMDVKVETNNSNKRILLFSDNEKVTYKTIYIKEKQRLKIIDIYEDKGQIFNETI